MLWQLSRFERQTYNRVIVGSNPTQSTITYVESKALARTIVMLSVKLLSVSKCFQLSGKKTGYILYWCNGSTLPIKEDGSVRYPA